MRKKTPILIHFSPSAPIAFYLSLKSDALISHLFTKVLIRPSAGKKGGSRTRVAIYPKVLLRRGSLSTLLMGEGERVVSSKYSRTRQRPARDKLLVSERGVHKCLARGRGKDIVPFSFLWIYNKDKQLREGLIGQGAPEFLLFG